MRRTRSASSNNVSVTVISSTAMAIRTGSVVANRSWPKRKTGKVGSLPARKRPSANSSNETMNAVSQAATIAGPMIGRTTQPQSRWVGRAEVHGRVLELRVEARPAGPA